MSIIQKVLGCVLYILVFRISQSFTTKSFSPSGVSASYVPYGTCVTGTFYRGDCTPLTSGLEFFLDYQPLNLQTSESDIDRSSWELLVKCF
ncbi:hypothetical protein BDR07DRAFT_1406518 [Suillus spraguei]|nr:hypothetical protein BDR07DRAFT_1406518 [Suillus spraguei]